MKKDEKPDAGKIIRQSVIAVVVAIAGYYVCKLIFLLIMPSVGGSFGYGFPGPATGGGKTPRDVIIDVDPQVVYRIDKNRFFTLENYVDCQHGGFVYYHDQKKNMKILITSGRRDNRPQDTLDIAVENDIMAYKGKFIYLAGDHIIAYPVRHRNYKYGGENTYIAYRDQVNKKNSTGIEYIPDIHSATIVDGAIYIKKRVSENGYRKYSTPNEFDTYEWINDADVNFTATSIDDHFHCDNTIKPRSVKYIKN